jgi:acetate kinase
MKKFIATINAGSSNIKCALFHAEDLSLISKEIFLNFDDAIKWILPYEKDLVAVGHRVVHGGNIFSEHQVVNARVLDQMKTLIPLAPLHEGHNIMAIEKIAQQLPHLKQIACFDTVFHHTLPKIEQYLPLPAIYWQKGIKRYGFHGLSYEYIASVLPDYLGAKAKGKVIVAHLGSGSSMCGLVDGKSQATSMGFSTLEGLMMATRSGTIDPGVLLYLLAEQKMTLEEVTDLLYYNSGLKGVSGISGDVRELTSSSDPQARLAIDLYCHLAIKQFGSIAAALRGVDALVFTGGIGENSQFIREQISQKVAWLCKSIFIIPTNEELVIAKKCKELIM